MARISGVYDSEAMGLCDGYREYEDCFGNIVEKDSPGKNFGFSHRIQSMNCLDMDKVEIAQHGNNDKTMDLVVGISAFDDVKQSFSAKCLLPVELKLNSTAFNLGQGDLLGKDEHTRQYVLGIGFAPESVFLFPERIVSHALNSINRWKRGTGSRKMANWHVMTPMEFNTFIKFSSDYPYVPQTDMANVKNKIEEYLDNNDVDGCYNFIHGDVKPKMEEYYKAYNQAEIKYVVENLKEIFDSIFERNHTIQDIAKQYLHLEIDTIEGLIG